MILVDEFQLTLSPLPAPTHTPYAPLSKYHTKCWLRTKKIPKCFHLQFPPGFSMLLIYSPMTWGNVNLKQPY